MKDSAFLTTITIERQEDAFDAVTKRFKTGTKTTVATGVKATVAPANTGVADSVVGIIGTRTWLLFVPAGTDLKKNDFITDENTGQVLRVTTTPFNYLNPITKTGDHMEAEVRPLEPDEV